MPFGLLCKPIALYAEAVWRVPGWVCIVFSHSAVCPAILGVISYHIIRMIAMNRHVQPARRSVSRSKFKVLGLDSTREERA